LPSPARQPGGRPGGRRFDRNDAHGGYGPEPLPRGQAAINDMKNNHPNDNLALIFFSHPADDQGNSGFYNRTRVPLGRDYARCINSLWFAPASLDPTKNGPSNRDIRPYGSDGAIRDVPRANGGTCYSYPFYLAYNQFGTNSTLPTGTLAARRGRR